MSKEIKTGWLSDYNSREAYAPKTLFSQVLVNDEVLANGENVKKSLDQFFDVGLDSGTITLSSAKNQKGDQSVLTISGSGGLILNCNLGIINNDSACHLTVDYNPLLTLNSYGILDLNGKTLTLNSSGTLNLNGKTLGFEQLGNGLDINGKILTLNSSGTLNLNTYTLTLNSGGSLSLNGKTIGAGTDGDTLIVNQKALTLNSNGALDLNGGTIYLDRNTIYLSDGTLDLSGYTLGINTDGKTLNVNGNILTLDSNGVLNLNGKTLGISTDGKTLNVNGNTLTLGSSGTLNLNNQSFSVDGNQIQINEIIKLTLGSPGMLDLKENKFLLEQNWQAGSEEPQGFTLDFTDSSNKYHTYLIVNTPGRLDLNSGVFSMSRNQLDDSTTDITFNGHTLNLKSTSGYLDFWNSHLTLTNNRLTLNGGTVEIIDDTSLYLGKGKILLENIYIDNIPWDTENKLYEVLTIEKITNSNEKIQYLKSNEGALVFNDTSLVNSENDLPAYALDGQLCFVLGETVEVE